MWFWVQCSGLVTKVLTLNMPGSYMVLILAALLPIQLPACGLGKQSRMAQSLETLHQSGRPGRVSWHWIGSAPAIAVTWRVNHRTEDLPLYLSSSLYI